MEISTGFSDVVPQSFDPDLFDECKTSSFVRIARGEIFQTRNYLCSSFLTVVTMWHWEAAARRLFVWLERLPRFDVVAVGIVYPGEAAVAFVLALRVDADASFRQAI
jgi:hypothetical protein